MPACTKAGLPQLGILARWDHSMGIAGRNCIVAFACIICPVRCPAVVCLQTMRGSCDAADLLTWRDLVEEFGWNGGVTDAVAGHFDCMYFHGFSSIPPSANVPFACRAVDVDLAPDAALRATRRAAGHCRAMSREGCLRAFHSPSPSTARQAHP